MTATELKKLEDAIALKRAEREQIATDIEQKRLRARKLSEEIRDLEGKLPPSAKRAGIRMSVEPATVAVKPRR